MAIKYMQQALQLAATAAKQGEVPVGAIVVKDGDIIAAAHNLTEQDNDPTAHAELLAIRAACATLQSTRLPGCDLYVTLEPCPMCATAISFARIKTLYFGAYDPKSGGVEHGPKIFQQATCHHAPEVIGGVQATKAEAQLQQFFAGLR